MDPSAPNRHYQILLDMLMKQRFMDMPAQRKPMPGVVNPTLEVPVQAAPTLSDTPMQPGQEWNRVDGYNLLGPTMPPQAPYTLRK